jgi:CARDB
MADGRASAQREQVERTGLQTAMHLESRTGHFRRAMVVSMTAITLFLIALTFGAASEASGKGKPDLVPTSGDISGKPFAFIGDRLRVTVQDTTENLGRRRAGPTITRVFLQHGRSRDEFAERAVGGLRPDGRDRGKSDTRGQNRFRAGAYHIVVCVDAKNQEKESNERNNCGRLERFYSTYRGWEGTLGSVGPGLGGSGTTETSKSTDASYGFDQYLGGGLFSWKADGGSVKYTHQGSANGCSYTGSATFALERFAPILADYKKERYQANAAPTFGATYTIVQQCGQSSVNAVGPVYSDALSTGKQTLTFGNDRLDGAAAFPTQGGTINQTWNLAGK